MSRFSRQLGFMNRNDPMQGFFIIMLLLLATQITRDRPDRSANEIVAFLASFVIATTLHELSHAVTAYALGDRTAKDLGRITLNPIEHFDPFGFIGMVMISLGYGLIGWGKPVPVNPARFKSRWLRPQRGMAVVAAAGPISNIVQATIVAIPLRLADKPFTLDGSSAATYGWIFVYVNVLLAAFNFIPIPPLDGSKILLGLVPRFWYPILAPLERYGFLILFVIFFFNTSITNDLSTAMINPQQTFLLRQLTGIDFSYL
jgi:Zn-dependent protease